MKSVQSSFQEMTQICQFCEVVKKKKVAAGHFTTIPCEPNTVNRRIESHIFGNFVSVLITL